MIVAAFGENIEGAELHFVVALARVKCVEIGDAIDAEHDCFAIEDEMLLADLARGLDDPRIATGPVVPAARDQAYPVALALKAKTVAVILYFMKPIRPARDRHASAGKAKLK
ncbi:hypothetical protein WN73_05735 [Bradyrhizobium sp. CCBAU 45394]|nr:hypothetical protein [Bradyrhizobium sp. CCBAU 45394]